jgi:hypothetical protein
MYKVQRTAESLVQTVANEDSASLVNVFALDASELAHDLLQVTSKTLTNYFMLF